MQNIDRIAVQTLVDNYIDVFELSTENIKRIAAGELKEPLIGGHGLAFLIEIQRGSLIKKILMDTSNSSQVLLHNMRALNVDLDEIAYVFLSHGHPDHYSGLEGFLKARSKPVDIYIHSDAFWPRYLMTPRGKTPTWTLEKQRYESIGANFKLVSQFLEIEPGLAFSGEIPRVTEFEKTWAGARIVKAGLDQDDLILDEQAFVANVKDKGLVIISACSHPGIINTVKHVQQQTGLEKIAAIIAGMHLAVVKEEVIDKTIAALKEISPNIVIPAHCTGFKAMSKLWQAMPKNFAVNTLGAKIII
jgi:7,8-dihydropterin-6-yl-methyl-4-(beta-D-ribofuranosyl)aminobenzene 5'-phosphate synthase